MAEPNAEEGCLANSLQVLLESGRDADVTLVVGGSQLPAHSFILAVRSPVFAAALRHDTQEARSNRIEVADVQEAVLKQLLCFMYTDTAPQMESMAAELLSAADKYDVPLLKKRCEQTLARDLSVDNAAATALLAEMHSCQLLKGAAVDFIATHPQVMATEGWVNVLCGNVEAAAQICKQVAVATPSSQNSSKQVAVAIPSSQNSSKQVAVAIPSSQNSCKKVAVAILSSQNRNLPEELKKDLIERLLRAASNGYGGEIWALLHAGAPVDAKDGSGNTALHLAVRKNRAAAVKLLIDAGADVNVRSTDQRTPLHRAVHVDDMGIIWLLLTASACVDAQDKEGNTPLHLAARYGYSEKVKALLVAGAKRDIKNTEGSTAYYMTADSSLRAVFDTY